MIFEKLTYCVCAIDFETVSGATELLKQTQIVEGSADEHKLRVEFLSRLAPHLVCPEEHAMRMVDQHRRAEFSQQPGRFTSQLSVGNSGLHMLKLRRRSWHRNNGLGTTKCWRLGGRLRRRPLPQ